MYGKEAYAFDQTFDRMDFLSWEPQPVHIFTDHRNLLYVFRLLVLPHSSPRHVLSKVQRWSIQLSCFDFLIEHMEGSRNLFTDTLTRWSKGYHNFFLKGNIAALYVNMVSPAGEDVATKLGDVIRELQKHDCLSGVDLKEQGL